MASSINNTIQVVFLKETYAYNSSRHTYYDHMMGITYAGIYASVECFVHIYVTDLFRFFKHDHYYIIYYFPLFTYSRLKTRRNNIGLEYFDFLFMQLYTS